MDKDAPIMVDTPPSMPKPPTLHLARMPSGNLKKFHDLRLWYMPKCSSHPAGNLFTMCCAIHILLNGSSGSLAFMASTSLNMASLYSVWEALSEAYRSKNNSSGIINTRRKLPKVSRNAPSGLTRHVFVVLTLKELPETSPI